MNNVLLNNCKQTSASLSLLVGMTVTGKYLNSYVHEHRLGLPNLCCA